MGCAVMAEVKGHRCSKKQMPDVSCYTASPADQDIIFIKPEVPFLLIGATEQRGGEGGARGGGEGEDQRWDDSRWIKRERLEHVVFWQREGRGGCEKREESG